MAKLAFMLALVQVSLVHGRPTGELRRDALVVEDRDVTLSTELGATTSYTSHINSLQTATVTVSPSVTGTINTGLPSGGNTQDPVKGPSITEPLGSLAPIQSTLSPGTTTPAAPVSADIFSPMATDAPPQQITARDDHPVQKIGIVDDNLPMGTNKFYANWFLGSQTAPVWTQPYSLAWAKGFGNTWGMAISHTERSQLAWDTEKTPPRYFIGPINMQHIVFSATELGGSTSLSTESHTVFSVIAHLAAAPGGAPLISLPCIQGMGFVTAMYQGATPQLNSGTFFRTLKYVGDLDGITYKYRIILEDNSEWLLYATPVASSGTVPFELMNSGLIEGPEGFVGIIQVAKVPAESSGERVYDQSAGAFAVNATISGNVNGNTGSYTISWGKEGITSQPLVMFALPHHVESFDETTAAALTNVELVTTTKGYARAIVADKMTLIENGLPTSIGFGPWVPSSSNGGDGFENINLNAEAITAINNAASLELAEDMIAQTSLNSMYYSGKGLAKFAGILYTLQSMAKNTQLAAAGLLKLKDAFNVFANNTQPLPLVYDSHWKGVVSSGSYATGDLGMDFGNSAYNDHHFHYGYFVYTAAVISYLDPAWLEVGQNKAWVNMLVRDYANPSANDPYFPQLRSFDWYHGHSWAKGLFESFDGKDQESSSEDTFATYALKMWGKISGDANLEARGNLQLALQARSLRNYFLLSEDNKVQPEQFLGNKVTGILFENKVDHTTYFGANPEYIQGIHMMPLNPSSAYTRPASFVLQEWNTYFSNGRVDTVQGGWRGVLYGNLAMVDPQTAYQFFSNPDFDWKFLDGGASRTWYLAFAAAMSGTGQTQGQARVRGQKSVVRPLPPPALVEGEVVDTPSIVEGVVVSPVIEDVFYTPGTTVVATPTPEETEYTDEFLWDRKEEDTDADYNESAETYYPWEKETYDEDDDSTYWDEKK
ncbi:glycoside hydrolase family 81 protein [Amniculicola lignicola CBS 123094]|uniref:glucan endo-1,3-beta-D-glucosidase n=1 Tax=Amniculicola lignicola CBS 123094 TaxID=1392246 RepID=A0A6A5WF92_9PLEO|nr:glycoside hydrolase family 81 protein [Amniculicola lignicola CBS 123094]